MSVVITSIDLVNDLLTSLEQLINSDAPMLNVDSSPNGSTRADAEIGINICHLFFALLTPSKLEISTSTLCLVKKWTQRNIFNNCVKLMLPLT